MSCQLAVADEPEVRERHAARIAHHPWTSNHRATVIEMSPMARSAKFLIVLVVGLAALTGVG
jgi:hypothetical protein